MRMYVSALVLASAFVASVFPAYAQKFQPKSIQFQGAPEYSNDELMAAAGLTKGAMLTAAEMQDRINRLSQTGVFDGVQFTFNGQDLIFVLKPAAHLYSVRLGNLPLGSGPEPSAALNAEIHAKLPLYHGKVPLEGGLLDGVRAILTDRLATLGIKATVQAAPFQGANDQAVGAMAFSISTPQILIGEVQPDGGAQLDPMVQKVLASITGSPYDVEGAPDAIVKDVSTIYTEMGYLDVQVEAARQPNLVVAQDAVRVPFRISLAPGTQYKVTAIQLAPDMLVSQADFDKQSHVHPGDLANAEHIAQNWHYIERQYHNRGYIKARIEPKATLDHSAHTVSYAVTAAPGPVYSMGKLTIENVSDDLRTMMLSAWTMPEGTVFNEGAILSYYAVDASVNAKLYRLFHAVNCKYTLHPNDDAKTVDVVLRLEKRQAVTAAQATAQ
jgi:outer membrane protein assembly factor BamA